MSLYMHDIATMLGLQKICIRSGGLCAQPFLEKHNRSHLLRASFSIYNTRDEIDRFIHSLKQTLHQLSIV